MRTSEDLIVVLDHPYGELELSLEEWVMHGPGERDLLRPTAVKDKRTGALLPVSVIPLRYQNTKLSRTLIAIGMLSDPWKK